MPCVHSTAKEPHALCSPDCSRLGSRPTPTRYPATSPSPLQIPQSPFCPLRQFNSFGYCPEYSFHASDEFLWFLPQFANYSWTALDEAFSKRMNSRVAGFFANGSVGAWEPFTEPPHEAPQDSLPHAYRAIDLAAPDRVVEGLKRDQCDFWLGHGFYETRGLIN